MKTSELTGAALDWAVAKCEGYKPCYTNGRLRPVFRTGMDVEPTWPSYSTDWAQCGPIMEREGIGATVVSAGSDDERWLGANLKATFAEYGPTCLVACMRTYVASKLGDTIDIPEELK